MFRFSLRTCLLTCLVICLLLLGLAKLERIRRDFAHAERISETSRLIEQLGGVVYETTAVIPVTIFKEGYHFRINLPESLRAIEIKGTINNSHDLGLPQFSVPGVMKDGVRGLGKGAGVAVLLERRERSDRSGSSTATRELRRGEVAK